IPDPSAFICAALFAPLPVPSSLAVRVCLCRCLLSSLAFECFSRCHINQSKEAPAIWSTFLFRFSDIQSIFLIFASRPNTSRTHLPLIVCGWSSHLASNARDYLLEPMRVGV